MATLTLFACVALAVRQAVAAEWAVLVAASKFYNNYRHQSDVCHAYHVLSARGFPDSHIIVMMMDDIVHDEANPFPGKLYNQATEPGVPGVDVYAGCKKDYTGKDEVTPAIFLSILKGDKTGVPEGKPVLESTAEDDVFIFYADHGATGLLAFPNSDLHAADLNSALTQANKLGRWKKAVFYVEACEAGSMFDKIIDPAIGVYVVTASDPTESSWGVFCPPFDHVDGKAVGSCLGDLFAVAWMNSSAAAGSNESLAAQFKSVQSRVATGSGGLYPHSSHVSKYGDLSFSSDPLSDYQGGDKTGAPWSVQSSPASNAVGMVPVRDIPMHLAYYRYLRTDKADITGRRAAAEALRAQLDSQIAADEFFLTWSTSVTKDAALAASMLVTAPVATAVSECGHCCPALHRQYREQCGGYTDYSIQYTRVVVHLCNFLGPGSVNNRSVVLGRSLQAMRCDGSGSVAEFV